MSKKFIFLFVLLFSLLIIIPYSFAEDSDVDLYGTNTIDENNLQETHINNEKIAIEESNIGINDSSNNNVLSKENSDDFSNNINEKQTQDGSKLSSSDAENSNDYTIKETTKTEVYLVKPINDKEAYILDSISVSPNTKNKFIIHISAYMGTGGGTVTLKFNGNSYSANIYNGEAIITAKTPSKAGTYKATLSYSGYTYVFGSNGYKYNPCSSTFTLKVKSSTASTASTTTVKAPTVTAYYKASKYFKVTVKKNGKAVKNLKLKVKVYTGSKYKTYTIKTNKNGVAKLSTKKFKVGSHKVKISSTNKKYKISKTSKIVIKKKVSYTTFKSPSGYTWKIKTTTWNKMKKEAVNNYKFFRSVGSYHPGYSDSSVTVKLTKNGHTYTGTAYAVQNSNYMRCEIRGAINGVYISNKGDTYV